MSKAPATDKQEFYGYPAPREVANIKLEYKTEKNPVLRGIALVIGAWVYVFDPGTSNSFKLIYEQCVETRVHSMVPMDQCRLQ
jgi:hypothetical protein